MRKLKQLSRLVRESHAQPLAGGPVRPPEVGEGETAITFIGHSSFLIQTAGLALLVDPVFANRLILLRRQRRPGIRVADLPPIDAVLLTHAHMDHLDRPSLRAVLREMRRRGFPAPVVVVPRDVEDLVADLGFRRIETLAWWQSVQLGGEHPSTSRPQLIDAGNNGRGSGGVKVTLTPARHWGARLFRDTHRGFGGLVIASDDGPAIYHSGDTAYFSGFTEIGQRLSPDVALLPIGAYSPDSYRAVHTSPEEALGGFLDLGAELMIPMHYGTFRLGREPIDEPLPRLMRAADQQGVAERVVALGEGESWVRREALEARWAAAN